MALNVVQRFRYQHDVRAYRRQLFATLAQSFAFRLLPGLKDLPINGMGRDGTLHPLEARMSKLPYITLAGEPGSGRRLALRQVALIWAATTGAPLPVGIMLPRLDDGHSAPETLIEQELTRQHPTIVDKMPPLFIPQTSGSGTTESHLRWGLLVEGLDELPPPRQAAWRAMLQHMTDIAAGTHLVVAVAAREPEWPGFSALRILSPSPDLLHDWIKRLGEPAQWTTLYDALRAGGALESLGQRLVEVALLAWVSKQSTLPNSRAELYTQAAIGLLRMFPDAGVSMDDLQRLAAYDEQPSALLFGILQQNAAGRMLFTHPLMRLYLAAHQLVAEQRYDLLNLLDENDRYEVARFAIGIADDPAPIYAALWGKQPGAANVLTLGHCLRENPSTQPAWMLRVAGALALLARDGSPTQRADAAALLGTLKTQLESALSAAARAGEQFQRAVMRLLALLSPDDAAHYAARLAYAADTPDELAWTLADQLAEASISPESLPATPTDQRAFARWAFVLALNSTESRARLIGAVDELLDVLHSSSAGDARLLRVATALVNDANLPDQARTAAVKLLEQNGTPDTLATIERTSHDAAPIVREAAQAALAQQAPQEANAVLAHTIFDSSAAPEMRVNAVRQLGARHAEGAGALLARAARDETLPLLGRLIGVAALGQDAEGSAYLHELLADAQLATDVRAAAARAIGASGDHSALPLLHALLNDPATAPTLTQGVCFALGELNADGSAGALLHVLEHTADDPVLTVAIIDALGALGAQDAVLPLSGLLGVGAHERLLHAVGPANLQQQCVALLHSNTLPAPLAARLATTLGTVCTPSEQPTVLAEFLTHEADNIRAAVTRALARIGGNSARAALHTALVDDALGGATDQALEALAQLDLPDNPTTLGTLIGDPAVNPMTRWLAVQRLREHVGSVKVLCEALAQADLDPFTRGALAEALGHRGDLVALSVLRQLATDPHGDEHVRAQAIIALGLLDDPATEGALLQIIRTSGKDETLHGLAAEHMPSDLSPDSRHFLRDLLRRERQPTALTAGVLRTLGHARDRESLPLLLRYCQDERAAVAQAALMALSDMADASIVPVLVQVSQNPGADLATRLQAVGTLLRVGGESYRPLLRATLEGGALPLRLQALEHLLEADIPVSDLLGMLASIEWPLPLRLRLLEHCGTTVSTQPVLIGILRNRHDHLQLRCRVATMLGHAEQPAATAALALLATDASEPLPLRLRCIEALGVTGNADVGVALSALATDDTQPPAVQQAAVQTINLITTRVI